MISVNKLSNESIIYIYLYAEPDYKEYHSDNDLRNTEIFLTNCLLKYGIYEIYLRKIIKKKNHKFKTLKLLKAVTEEFLKRIERNDMKKYLHDISLLMEILK